MINPHTFYDYHEIRARVIQQHCLDIEPILHWLEASNGSLQFISLKWTIDDEEYDCSDSIKRMIQTMCKEVGMTEFYMHAWW